jgi:hypothetical protein
LAQIDILAVDKTQSNSNMDTPVQNKISNKSNEMNLRLWRQVEFLGSETEDKFELWKFYDERADKYSERLWTTGTWLMAFLAVIIAVPFSAGYISTKERLDSIGFVLEKPKPVLAVSIFGMVFCGYVIISLLDIKKHIEHNWKRAKMVEQGNHMVEEMPLNHRKKQGWNILFVVDILAFFGFSVMLLLSLVKISQGS